MFRVFWLATKVPNETLNLAHIFIRDREEVTEAGARSNVFTAACGEEMILWYNHPQGQAQPMFSSPELARENGREICPECLAFFKRKGRCAYVVQGEKTFFIPLPENCPVDYVEAAKFAGVEYDWRKHWIVSVKEGKFWDRSPNRKIEPLEYIYYLPSPIWLEQNREAINPLNRS